MNILFPNNLKPYSCGCFGGICINLRLISLFGSQRESWREIFHQPVHSPEAQGGQVWARLKQGPGVLCKCQRSNHLNQFPRTFSGHSYQPQATGNIAWCESLIIHGIQQILKMHLNVVLLEKKKDKCFTAELTTFQIHERRVYWEWAW